MQVLTTGVAPSLASQLVVELHQLVQALGLQIQIHQTGANMQIQEPVQIPDLRVQTAQREIQELEQVPQAAGVCLQIEQPGNLGGETYQQSGKVKQEKIKT